MARRHKSALDLAADALERHVRALAEKQNRNGSGELAAPDMAAMVRIGELLLAMECGRANIVLKALGKRVNSMKLEDLQDLIITVLYGSSGEEQIAT